MRPLDFHKLNSRLPQTIKRGFVDDARRKRTPYYIDIAYCYEDARQEVRFLKKYHLIMVWLHEKCDSKFEVETLRDDRQRLVGRRFRFASPNEALWFKLCFV